MARSKKENQNTEQADSLQGEHLPQNMIAPQTDMEPLRAASIADLELQAAETLDPDAPQTDEERKILGGENLENAAALQTDPGNEPMTEDGGDEPDDLALPQTDMESESGVVEKLKSYGEFLTHQSSMGAKESEADAAHVEIPEHSSDTTDTPAEAVPSDSAEVELEQSQKLKMPGRRQRVLSIDEQRSVETDMDRQRNDLLDLVESLKSQKILTGTLQGIEHGHGGIGGIYGITYHGVYKILIPVLEAIDEPEDYRGQPKNEVLYYLLNKRMHAEIDYIVKGIDQEHNLIAASRKEAMAKKRKAYYFKTDRDGNYQVHSGIRAEARVVSVIRAGIFVDVFGAECYIPLRELSYQRWMDAAQHYQTGQRVLVRVLEVDRSDEQNLRVQVSVKQVSANPHESAMRRLLVGERYVGVVTMVDLTGVFVALDGGITCLCKYPPRGRPPRGCHVTVRILGIDPETKQVWGVITHMSAVR